MIGGIIILRVNNMSVAPKISALAPDRTRFGIGMALLGTTIIASADLATKWLTADLSLWQLQSMRSLFAILLLLPLLLLSRKLAVIQVKKLKMVLIRSLLMTACYILFFGSLAVVPIALVAGGFYCAPLFIVLLSWLMLKENVGVWRLTSVISGFLGVLLILQPTSSTFEWVLVLPVICGFLYALTQVVTRKYCKDEDPLALSFWLTVAFFISGLIGVLVLLSLPAIQDPGFMTRPAIFISWDKTLVLIVIGAASLVMHFALAAAYQNAPGSLVGPLEYLYLPIAVIGGYFFFDETPKLSALIGIAIIISAGLIIAWREQKLENRQRLE